MPERRYLLSEATVRKVREELARRKAPPEKSGAIPANYAHDPPLRALCGELAADLDYPTGIYDAQLQTFDDTAHAWVDVEFGTIFLIDHAGGALTPEQHYYPVICIGEHSARQGQSLETTRPLYATAAVDACEPVEGEEDCCRNQLGNRPLSDIAGYLAGVRQFLSHTEAGCLEWVSADDCGDAGSSGSSGACEATTTDYQTATAFENLNNTAADAWSNMAGAGDCAGTEEDGAVPGFDQVGSQNYATSDILICRGFGFNVPAGATNLAVRLKLLGTSYNDEPGSTNPRPAYEYTIRLIDADDNYSSTDRATNRWTDTETEYIFGGDDWGMTLTPEKVNDPDFGVAIQLAYDWASGAAQLGHIVTFLRCVQLEVCYTPPE